VEKIPLFKLCEAGDANIHKYFLFNDAWNYNFYKVLRYLYLDTPFFKVN
jgi:hypothetical protein